MTKLQATRPFQNIKSRDIKAVDSKILYFLSCLGGMGYYRRLKGSGPDFASIDFADSDGLCEGMLEEICKKLSQIKSKFPDRVNNCALFANVDDDAWRKKFQENFAKLFVDRQDYDPSKGPYQYNEKQVTKGGSKASGANLCYIEGCMAAFLFMLDAVEKKFAEGKNFLEEKEFAELLCDFNAIAIVENSINANFSTRAISTGGNATYEEALKATAALKGYNENCDIFYDFEGALVTVYFDEGFDHMRVLRRLYHNYAKVDFSPETLFRLCDGCSNYAHLFRDGNGRDSTFMGWCLSLLQNKDYPTSVYPGLNGLAAIQEGQKWIAAFLADPEIPSMSPEAEELKVKLSEQSCFQNPIESCLSKIFGGKKPVSFPVVNRVETLRFVDPKSLSSGDILITHRAYQGKDILPINVTAMVESLEDENLSEAQEENLEVRDFMLMLLTKQRMDESEEELFKEEKNFLGQLNIVLLREQKNPDFKRAQEVLDFEIVPHSAVQGSVHASTVKPPLERDKE